MEKAAEICNFDFPHYVLEKKMKESFKSTFKKIFFVGNRAK